MRNYMMATPQAGNVYYPLNTLMGWHTIAKYGKQEMLWPDKPVGGYHADHYIRPFSVSPDIMASTLNSGPAASVWGLTDGIY